MHPFRNFLAVLPPPTLYKVETQKKILDTRVQHCLWGEGRSWTCVNWKTLQKRRCPKTFVNDCRWGLYHGGLMIGARGGLYPGGLIIGARGGLYPGGLIIRANGGLYPERLWFMPSRWECLSWGVKKAHYEGLENTLLFLFLYDIASVDWEKSSAEAS